MEGGAFSFPSDTGVLEFEPLLSGLEARVLLKLRSGRHSVITISAMGGKVDLAPYLAASGQIDLVASALRQSTCGPSSAVLVLGRLCRGHDAILGAWSAAVKAEYLLCVDSSARKIIAVPMEHSLGPQTERSWVDSLLRSCSSIVRQSQRSSASSSAHPSHAVDLVLANGASLTLLAAPRCWSPTASSTPASSTTHRSTVQSHDPRSIWATIWRHGSSTTRGLAVSHSSHSELITFQWVVLVIIRALLCSKRWRKPH